MSKNRNRARMKQCIDNKSYNILYMKTYIDPWDECWTENHHGQLPSLLRSYKTWKHTRKTKYKE